MEDIDYDKLSVEDSSFYEELRELERIYETVKELIKRRDPQEFKRWKSGGYIVDTDVYSTYPNIFEVGEKILMESLKDKNKNL